MTCEEIKEILSSYVDGEAGGDEGLLVERHLAACAGCRDVARRMRMVGAGIEKTEGAVPPGFRETLFARMEREGLLRRRRSLFAYSVRWAAIPAAAAAVLALFLLTSREAGKVGPTVPAGPRQAMTEGQPSAPQAPKAAIPPEGQAPRGQEGRIVAERTPEPSAPAVGKAVADSRVGADLTPEDRDVVANLDVLEDSAAFDQPSGIDELDIVEPAGGRKG